MSALSVPVTPLSDFAWFSEAEGTRPSAIDPAAYTSLARWVRTRYDANISPVVREYVILSETNRYGDDVVATVQYNRQGHCSSVGGSLDADGHIVWSCYAD